MTVSVIKRDKFLFLIDGILLVGTRAFYRNNVYDRYGLDIPCKFIRPITMLYFFLCAVSSSCILLSSN